MPTSTLTSKGQITIPKAVRERLGLRVGDVLEFVVSPDGSIRLELREAGPGVVGVLRDLAPESPVSVDEMRDALRRRAAEQATK